MAVSVESFLNLETSLSSRLFKAWRRETNKVLRKIIEFTSKRDFAGAHDLVNTLDISDVVERNTQFIDLIGIQAALFGASQFTPPKQAGIVKGGKPEEIRLATELLQALLEQNGDEAIKRKAHTLITEEEVAQTEESYKQEEVRKANTRGFVRKFNTSVTKEGKAFINLGSSLHTSRLGAWGFLTEATLVGADTYQVSEQLDNRTCPVCRTMHGKVFSITPAKTRLDSTLKIRDPDQLKSIAPFPNQSRQGIAKLQGMSNSEIQQNGWDTPPYHPLCRGILVKTGSVTTVTQQVPTQIPQSTQVPIVDIPDEIPFASTAEWGARFRDPSVSAEQIISGLSLKQRKIIRKWEADLKKLTNTDKQFQLPDGSWTPARTALHKKKIAEYFEAQNWRAAIVAEGSTPELVVLGGRGGSGKGFLTSEAGPIDASRYVVMDSDEFKKLLPEFKGWNAAQVHEESSHMLELALTKARELNVNVVLDGTLAKLPSAQRKIDAFLAAGYETTGFYMHTPSHIAANRAINRATNVKPGKVPRYVPVQIILDSVANEVNFDIFIQKGIFGNRWQVWDNTGTAPRLVGRATSSTTIGGL